MPAADFTTDPLASAAARPEKIAIIDLASGTRQSYAELTALVARAAAWITAQLGGKCEGERVVYVGRNGVELLALALGAERCGAIFAPLNWRLAAPELAALIEDCSPLLVVAQDEFMPLLPAGSAIVASLDHTATAASAASARLAADRPIVLLYTSGTTGRPKGVVVTAMNAFAAALNFISVGELGPDCVAMSDLPMFHTIGLIAVARSTLMSGGTLVTTDRFAAARTLSALADSALGITHYFAVPVLAEALLGAAGFAPEALTRLRAVFMGGAPLAPSLIERFLSFGVPLVNGYGMSEAGTAIHVPIDREIVRQSAGAVGLPAPHMAVRLVRDGQDIASGEVGEIWLRGPAVSPGYWRQPKETAAAFAEGWYRTGDLARQDPNGFYHLIDRLKDMYISGGENVFPAEVETVLAAHPAIADAAVLGVPDARWGESGVAFVVSREAPLDAEALRAHCVARLAKYKIPNRFIAVDAIPRSAAGKILKPALRARLNRGEFR